MFYIFYKLYLGIHFSWGILQFYILISIPGWLHIFIHTLYVHMVYCNITLHDHGFVCCIYIYIHIHVSRRRHVLEGANWRLRDGELKHFNNHLTPFGRSRYVHVGSFPEPVRVPKVTIIPIGTYAGGRGLFTIYYYTHYVHYIMFSRWWFQIFYLGKMIRFRRLRVFFKSVG